MMTALLCTAVSLQLPLYGVLPMPLQSIVLLTVKQYHGFLESSHSVSPPIIQPAQLYSEVQQENTRVDTSCLMTGRRD